MDGAGANQAYNFCSGPAMLPASVLAQAQQELLNYQSQGISIMEMSHRSNAFLQILASAKQGLKQLLSIPDNYSILFMQGGASLQFSAVPLNLNSKNGRAGYVNTGYWSQKAMKESCQYLEVVELATSEHQAFKTVPDISDLTSNDDLDFIHCTPNETIGGVEFADYPETGQVPLVADMSSCILSRPLDISKFGLIYAGAQKNIGPAGLGVVIIRDDLMNQASSNSVIPRLLNYREVNDQNSMANTPPTFAIYLADLVFQWLLDKGGVAEIEKVNSKKAQLLYETIDQSSVMFNDVEPAYRSRMNVPFFFHESEVEALFLKQATDAKLLNLPGHRSQGGCRASIYNAMPLQGVATLCDFIKNFENNYV